MLRAGHTRPPPERERKSLYMACAPRRLTRRIHTLKVVPRIRKPERSRGGLVSKTLRFLYHSTLGSRAIKKKTEKKAVWSRNARPPPARGTRWSTALLPKVNLPHAIDFGGHVTFNVLVTLRSMFRGEEDSLVQERREQGVRVHHLLVPVKEGGEI